MNFRLPALAACLALAAPLAQAQSVGHGQTLYMSICINCHGFPPGGGPELAANNPGLIDTALNIIAQMRPFRSQLSESDVADIAAYLGTLHSGGGNPPPPPPPPGPQFDYTDQYFIPAESGWGINVVQHASGNLFCILFNYVDPGRPYFLAIPGGTWVSNTVFTGNVYAVTGTPGDRPYVAGPVAQVGTATITFDTQSTMTLTYSFNGVQVTKSLQRQPF
ncbi:MAG TPA: cytochrome c [Usitatibacter sp.]|nr:cytochrome c [Usitatibacter sp.]